jgi:Holliday junction resolvasome RuvABC endonuclease subunit
MAKFDHLCTTIHHKITTTSPQKTITETQFFAKNPPQKRASTMPGKNC